MATFPTTTELLVGQGTDLRTYPEFPDATLVESDIACVECRIYVNEYD